MPSIFSLTAANALSKQIYSKDKVEQLVYPDHPFFGMIPKKTDLVGNSFNFDVAIGTPQTRSVTFSNAQATTTQGVSNYRRFIIPTYSDYATANWNGDVVDLVKDEASFIDSIESETDRALDTASRSLATAMYRDGGGSRGQISATSNTGTNTITLANITDITNFELDMALQVSSDSGTGGAGVRAGTVYVIGLDRDLGTIKVSTALGGGAANWTAGIAAAAAGDYIFQIGDYPVGGAGARWLAAGLAGWCPSTAPSGGENFYNVDRSADATRLAGVRVTGGGAPYEETIISVLARTAVEGAKTSHILANPIDVSKLVKGLSAKNMYDRASAPSYDNAQIGYEGVKVLGPKGAVTVVSDQDCPQGQGYAIQMKDWLMMSNGKAPRFVENDGLRILRASTSDAYECRIVSRWMMYCKAPGHQASFTW